MLSSFIGVNSRKIPILSLVTSKFSNVLKILKIKSVLSEVSILKGKNQLFSKVISHKTAFSQT
ncbi:TPA: hypothetical protein DEG21_01550 [Patescibacteria group bacterium]|nr:hypothetical protein [Candidatus Gracilibacteria bacterium]HBY74575.1 hypothetical protein [Candidatus Gracilibacteria bacterium]